ncbi:MAG: hypothetical protein KDE56_20755 [Anaerolineales bacterium]|nr:hypothetical protein [Anaerolineales bacterium]
MFDYATAIKDFHEARRQARLEELFGRFTGQTLDLLAFDEVRKMLRASSQIERGLQEVPLDAIVGSVGRYRDFTRTFLPKLDSDKERWARVKVAQSRQGLPPIEVYQVGEVYFVKDGNHRVSIARQEGSPTIEAYVTEIQTAVPLTTTTDLDDLIIKAEYADFLRQTQLDHLRPEADLTLTSPGKYPLLLEHIEVHRYYMGLNEGREIPYETAVSHWYDTVFAPAIRLIRDHGLMAEFPERTSADFYLWLAENRADIEAELGGAVSTQTAVTALAEAVSSYKPSSLLSRALQTVTSSSGPTRATQWWYEQSLKAPAAPFFATILVPLAADDSGWQAVEQALLWAKAEGSQIIGLLAVAQEVEKNGLIAQTMQAAFAQRSTAHGLTPVFKVETGDLSPLTRRLARWADLIVLPIPASSGSGGWERVRHTPGVMLLAPPAPAHPIHHILLAYDDSPYAQQAVLLAFYLHTRWQRPLTILTSPSHQPALQEALAPFQQTQPHIVAWSQVTAVAILETAQQTSHPLVVLGGYTPTAVLNPRRDMVEALIRETAVPLLLCR